MQVFQGVGNTLTYLAMEDGALISGTIQDCTPIAENVAALRAAGHVGTGDIRHAGRIPFAMIEKYCHINHIEYRDFCINKDHWQRLLNDPHLSKFRVWQGTV